MNLLSQLTTPAVHTTGINWDSIIAIAAEIAIIVGAVGAIVTRSIKRSVREQISSVIAKEVTPELRAMGKEIKGLDTRTARLEGIEEGRKSAIAAAGVTTT